MGIYLIRHCKDPVINKSAYWNVMSTITLSRCSKYRSRLVLTTPHIRGEKLTDLDLGQGTTDLLGLGKVLVRFGRSKKESLNQS